jgi:hypothetical protein
MAGSGIKDAQLSVAVDWRALLFELRTAHGMTLMDIAREVGRDRHTLMGYRDRKWRPKHSDGEVIIGLWMRITGKDRGRLPMEYSPVSAAATRGL